MPPILNLAHERRSFNTPATRPALAEEVESRRIEGLAIVYESESEVLYDWWEDRKFVEIIHRGAVTEELLASSDVLALYEHDRSKLLARSTNRVGSLNLTITSEGLRYAFDAPKTQLGEDTLELLRRGDLRASSFLFAVGKGDSRWEQKSDGTWIRHIDHISFLGDVSVVSQPAYPSSDATARSIPDVNFPEVCKEDPILEPRSLSPLEAHALRRADLLS
ncbi:MAG: HK97 family phage prohead protease [Porphyromonadaceae bacterium]|nr:HK97 family phage prohead protease [Porphyromonadaceae bacterium]